MKNTDLINEIAVRTSTRKLIWLLLIVSIVTNMLVAIALVSNKQVTQTVLVPPKINRTLAVSNVDFSKEYLEEMAPYAAHLLLSGTPQTAAYNHQLLLGMTAPQYHDALEKELILTQRYLQRNNVSTYYTAKGAAADINDNTVILEGNFVATSQGKVIADADRKLIIKFENKSGKLGVTSIKEVKETGSSATEVETMDLAASGPTVTTVKTHEKATEYKAGTAKYENN